MHYFGYIQPLLPVNAFVKTVYEDSHSVRYTAVVEGKKIARFTQVDDYAVLQKIDADFTANIGDMAVYTYITETGNVETGHYEQMLKNLLPYFHNPDYPVLAKLILYSFFKFHGLTIGLINEAALESNVKIRSDNFLPRTEVNEDLDAIKIELDYIFRLRKDLQSTHEFKFTEFIYCDIENTYIQNLKIPNDILAVFIDWENSDSDYRNTLLDVLGDYQKHSSDFITATQMLNHEKLYTKDTSWLSNLVFMRLMAKGYEVSEKELENTKSAALFGYGAEKKMYEISQNDESPAFLDPTILEMSIKVKNVIKNRRNEPAYSK